MRAMTRDLGRTRWGRNGPSSCPRATLAFVGREAELARIAELLDREVLFLIYGVAGIGKSEFAYRALELVRARPEWKDVVPTLVQMQDGMDEHHLLALLRLRSGAHADADIPAGRSDALARRRARASGARSERATPVAVARRSSPGRHRRRGAHPRPPGPARARQPDVRSVAPGDPAAHRRRDPGGDPARTAG